MAADELRPAYVKYGAASPLSDSELDAAEQRTGLSLPSGWTVTEGQGQRMAVAFATDNDVNASGLAKGELFYAGSKLPPIRGTVDLDSATLVAERNGSRVEIEVVDVSAPLGRAWADFVLGLQSDDAVRTSSGRGFVSGSGAALDLGTRLVRMNYESGSGGDDLARLNASSIGMREFFNAVSA